MLGHQLHTPIIYLSSSVRDLKRNYEDEISCALKQIAELNNLKSKSKQFDKSQILIKIGRCKQKIRIIRDKLYSDKLKHQQIYQMCYFRLNIPNQIENRPQNQNNQQSKQTEARCQQKIQKKLRNNESINFNRQILHMLVSRNEKQKAQKYIQFLTKKQINLNSEQLKQQFLYGFEYQIIKQSHQIANQLIQNKLEGLKTWCQNHSSLLKKQKSNLEYKVFVFQFIHTLNNFGQVAAVNFMRKYLEKVNDISEFGDINKLVYSLLYNQNNKGQDQLRKIDLKVCRDKNRSHCLISQIQKIIKNKKYQEEDESLNKKQQNANSLQIENTQEIVRLTETLTERTMALINLIDHFGQNHDANFRTNLQQSQRIGGTLRQAVEQLRQRTERQRNHEELQINNSRANQNNQQQYRQINRREQETLRQLQLQRQRQRSLRQLERQIQDNRREVQIYTQTRSDQEGERENGIIKSLEISLSNQGQQIKNINSEIYVQGQKSNNQPVFLAKGMQKIVDGEKKEQNSSIQALNSKQERTMKQNVQEEVVEVENKINEQSNQIIQQEQKTLQKKVQIEEPIKEQTGCLQVESKIQENSLENEEYSGQKGFDERQKSSELTNLQMKHKISQSLLSAILKEKKPQQNKDNSDQIIYSQKIEAQNDENDKESKKKIQNLRLKQGHIQKIEQQMLELQKIPDAQIKNTILVNRNNILSYLWDLYSTFVQSFALIYRIPIQTIFDKIIAMGITVLKTPSCHYIPNNTLIFKEKNLQMTCKSKNKECLVCTSQVQMLGKKLPIIPHNQSSLICRINGQLMNQKNPPLILPNGQIYSLNGLQKTIRKGKYQCILSKKYFRKDACQKVFLI